MTRTRRGRRGTGPFPRAAVVIAAAWMLSVATPALSQSTGGSNDPAEGPDPQRLVLEAGAPLAPGELYRVAPRRVEQPPRIDGRLDEPAWQSAAILDAFVQQEPAEGEPATEATIVRLLYDARALYVGVEAFDYSRSEVDRGPSSSLRQPPCSSVCGSPPRRTTSPVT